MKRLTILTFSVLLIILLVNYLYYSSLYNKQVNYVKDLLGQQIALTGSEVYHANLNFERDLDEIIRDGELNDLFNEDTPKSRDLIIEKLKFFYGKYENFIETIEYNGPETQVFLLYRDLENEAWIANNYLAQDQAELIADDRLEPKRNKWDLVKPVYSTGGSLTGNIIITVDYIKYFRSLFSKYKIEEQQWQWLLDGEGNVVFSNYFDENIANRANIDSIEIGSLKRINDDISKGINGNTEHFISVSGQSRRVISSYYAVDLLRKNYGMVFSVPGDFYQIYIIRNSLLIVSLTIVMVIFLVLMYRRHIRGQKYNAGLLEESEQSMVRLIESLPVGVVVVNKNNEVITANESAANMFNYRDGSEMKGKMMPETEPSGKGVYFAETLGPGYEASQFMMINRQGVDTVLYRKEIPVTYLEEDAEMIVLMDVTLLELAHKQESRSRKVKSEFISKISHEIRTPLNGIIGIADLLLKRENDPETQKLVNLVKSSSDQLMEIINDMMDFSKMEEGSMMLDEVPFELGSEIDYCFNITGASSRKDVDFNWKLASDVPPRVIGDPFRFRQVISHLLNTSLEHTEKGEIRLDVSAEEEGEDGKVKIDFDLRDTGSAYDRAMLKKMYGEYIKADSSEVSSAGSKIVGGRMTRQLIEMMGGHLKPSTPSGLSEDPEAPGARFEFSMRMYSGKKIEKDYGADKVKKLSDIKTLVISGVQERDENLLGTMHKYGLATYVTSWQKQTVNLIRSNLENVEDRYKLIIIIDTPDFNGFEVAKELAENNLHTAFLILMISSNDKKGNYVRCIHYGIDEYLVKPYSTGELMNIIRSRFAGIEAEGVKELPEDVRQKLKVLVVEDNLISQKVAVAILKNLGLKADVAKDGNEGVEKASATGYDIVFMDLIMPGMDGYTASKKILEQSPGTIIIALSADSNVESVQKASIAGISQYITKPVKQEDVREIIVKYFSK